MNCCNHNCREGRDCPVRLAREKAARIQQARQAHQASLIAVGRMAWALISLILLAVCAGVKEFL
jgi:hypothetical protein